MYLPFLEKIDGNILLLGSIYDEEKKEWALYNDFSVEKFMFPVLKEVGISLSSAPNTVIKSIEMPMLEKIEKGLSLNRNEALEFLDFSMLREIGRSLYIVNCPNIKHIDFPKLKELYTGGISTEGSFTLLRNDSLEKISFPKLERVGRTFSISWNPELKHLEFPVLKQVSYYNTGFFISDNLALIEMLFPVLENIYGDFKIMDNYSLENLSFPKLERVQWDFWILDNHELPTSIAVELKNQVLEKDGIGGETAIFGNK